MIWPSSGLSRPVRAMPAPMPSGRSLRFFALQPPAAEPQVVAMREPSAPAASVPAAAEAPPTLASPRFIPLRSFGASAASSAGAAPMPLKPLPARAVWPTVAHVEAGRGRGANAAPTAQARQGAAGSRIAVLGGPSLFASAR